MTDRRELREKQLIGELSHYGWRISPDKRTMRKWTKKEIEEIEALTAGKEVIEQLVERRKDLNVDEFLARQKEILKGLACSDGLSPRPLIYNHNYTSYVDDDGVEHIKYGPLTWSYGPAQPETLWQRVRRWLLGRGS